MDDLADSFPVVGRMLVVLINIYLWLPLMSLLSERASSTVIPCLVHCISVMLHFRYLQKVQSLYV